MPLPRELNPSDREPFVTQLDHQGLHTVQDDNAGLNLQARIAELEARNLHLQSLVVELLDKNEQLRREARRQGKAANELLSQ
jgi:hypothetical protein